MAEDQVDLPIRLPHCRDKPACFRPLDHIRCVRLHRAATHPQWSAIPLRDRTKQNAGISLSPIESEGFCHRSPLPETHAIFAKKPETRSDPVPLLGLTPCHSDPLVRLGWQRIR